MTRVYTQDGEEYPAKSENKQGKVGTIKEIKVGDICYLRSGSPRMTVTTILEDNIIQVTWCKYDLSEMRVWNLPLEALRVDW